MKWNQLSEKTRIGLVALVFFLVGLLLNWSSFFPELGEINPWDEAAYVHGGLLLLQGNIPIFAGSPLSASLYAIFGLFFQGSPFWFLSSIAAVRLIAYSLIWLSAYLIGKQLKAHVNPIILLGILLAAPFLIKMLRFPTDPLFMGFAGLALWKLIAFYQSGKRSSVLWAGVFLALAAATRNDGLVVFMAAIIWLVAVVIIKRWSWLSIVSFALPFITIVGGYVLLYGWMTGNYSLGTIERTYDNFEAGQIAVYRGAEGVNAAADAKREARRIFGTPEENDYSILQAISKNPGAYFERLKRVTLELPGQMIKAYSGKWIVLFAFWVVWGLITLIRKKEGLLIALYFAWISPFFSGFLITIFRTGHLLFPSLVLISLAAIGLHDFAMHSGDRKYQVASTVLIILILVMGLVYNEFVVIYAASLCLAAFFLIWLAHAFKMQWANKPEFALMLLLSVGMILHGPYTGVIAKPERLPDEEQALLAMEQTFPVGARILAGSPGVVYAAKMSYLGLSSTDVPFFQSSIGFVEWMKAQQVDGIYIDQTMMIDNAFYWNLLSEMKSSFIVIFQNDTGSIQIWGTGK